MNKIFKKYNIEVIYILLIIVSLILIPFKFKYAHIRIYESCIDIKNSVLYYISTLFNINVSGEHSVIKITPCPFDLPFNLPVSWEEFKVNISSYWSTFFNSETLSSYILVLSKILLILNNVILILVPIIIIIILIKNQFRKENNNDYGKESKALIKYKQLEEKVFNPCINWLKKFIKVFNDNGIIKRMLIIIWCYNFNIITIILECIAYMFFFLCSLKTYTIYIQFVKLLMDLSVMINFIPILIWCLIGWFIFNKIRKNIALNNLNHMENMNRGFINERPIVLMTSGTMGKGKTTLSTDMSISLEIMFRDKAFEKMLECDLMFPDFNWILFENSLKKAIKNHIIYNLATARKFIALRKKYFYNSCMKNKFIWEYDYKRYGCEYYNNLTTINIWNVLENYAQLYFIYFIESSLILSNYSIRTDNFKDDLGNFPLWNNELFNKTSDIVNFNSRHSHILDFDSLRLGKQIIEDNKYANSFEFGVINITEIGKERGNNLENISIKKNDSYTNQKNDLFNAWLKMVRHSATVDNYPFVKVICDEQRPESWGADARDLCEIVFIKNKNDKKLALPLFYIEELIYNLLVRSFKNKYYDYRYKYGDMILPMYLYHKLVSKYNRFYKHIYNQFSYSKLDIIIENGTQDGELKNSKYYLMDKKVYSDRFSTDAFSDYFNEKALKSKYGINDLPAFNNTKASFDEMLQENSYFFNDLAKLKNKKND